MDHTDAFNAFAGQLINHFIDANHTGNFFISPLSISTCLGMLLLGCRNNSSDQLVAMLKFSKNSSLVTSDNKSIFQSYLNIIHNLQRNDGKEKLVLLNKAFIRDSSVLPEYQKLLSKYFLSSIETLDDSSMTKANDWVAKVTEGKIKSILTSKPDALDKMILLNAIYFKGKWAHMFPPENTQKSPFMVNGNANNTRDVQMMKLPKTKLNYSEFMLNDTAEGEAQIGVQVVELPYEGTQTMVIFLPLEGQSVNSLLSSGSESLSSLMDKFDTSKRRREVVVHLPKFTFDLERDLTGILGELGAGDLIQSGVADLSGIDGTRNLYVSQMMHKSVIEVNEEGTVAAASTGLVVSMRSFSFVPIFNADRPFIFVIRDSSSHLISFVGKAADLR